ncbi:hypothetical protein Bca4012_092808 [Brassica carinata]
MVRNFQKPKSLRDETDFICDFGFKLGILCSESDKPWHVLRSLLENCVVLSFGDILVYNNFFDKQVEPWLRDSRFELDLLCSEYKELVAVLKLFLKNHAISCLDSIMVYNTYFDIHHQGLKHLLHDIGKESLVFDLNKGMCCIDNSGYLVFALSIQEQQDQSQRSKSKHHPYHPEIWRWKYLRKMTSKLKGSLCPKPYFDVVSMLIFLIICLTFYLFPFDIGDTYLRTNLFKGGGDDATMVELDDYATKDKHGWMNRKLEDEP